MHEKLVLLGFAKNFKFQLTVKEVQENVAVHISANLMGGWFQFNQGFRMTDDKDGGIHVVRGSLPLDFVQDISEVWGWQLFSIAKCLSRPRKKDG